MQEESCWLTLADRGWAVSCAGQYWQEHPTRPRLFFIFTYCTFFCHGLSIILNCGWDNSWLLTVQRLTLLINFSSYSGSNATQTAKTIMTLVPAWCAACLTRDAENTAGEALVRAKGRGQWVIQAGCWPQQLREGRTAWREFFPSTSPSPPLSQETLLSSGLQSRQQHLLVGF